MGQPVSPPAGDGSCSVLSPHQPHAPVPSPGLSESVPRLRPAALRGLGGARVGAARGTAWGQQQLTRQCLRGWPAPVLPSAFPGGPAPSQRPRLAAGGAGSAGFQQKPARTRNGPAGRGSFWAELTVAQPDAPSPMHQESRGSPVGAPHTPLAPFWSPLGLAPHVPASSAKTTHPSSGPGCAGRVRALLAAPQRLPKPSPTCVPVG